VASSYHVADLVAGFSRFIGNQPTHRAVSD
jgi:hypothetical protein